MPTPAPSGGGNIVTKKIGPLPLWAYAVGIGAAYFLLRGGRTPSADSADQNVSSAGAYPYSPLYPSTNLLGGSPAGGGTGTTPADTPHTPAPGDEGFIRPILPRDPGLEGGHTPEEGWYGPGGTGVPGQGTIRSPGAGGGLVSPGPTGIGGLLLWPTTPTGISTLPGLAPPMTNPGPVDDPLQYIYGSNLPVGVTDYEQFPTTTGGVVAPPGGTFSGGHWIGDILDSATYQMPDGSFVEVRR